MKTNSNDIFQEESYRFIVVFLYMLVSALTATINYSFSPITSSLELAYSTSEFDIYYLSMSYSILFIPMNFVANFIIERYGVKPSILICCSLQTVCAFLRIFINSGFGYVMLGQSIGALGNPFAASAISKVSLNWFLPQNRIASTAFMSSSYMIGTSLTFLLGGLVVNENSSLEEIKQQVQTLMIIYAIFAGSSSLLVAILMRERPKTPTSYVSEIPREGYCSALKSMSLQKDYIFLCLGFSFLLSNYVIFTTFINYLISPFGFTQSQISYFGFGINLACVAGKILIGFFAGSFAVVCFFAIVLGFFLQMYWAPSLEFACEIVFPISEANANGNMILSGCIFNTSFGLIFSAVLDYFEDNVGVEITFSYFFVGYSFSLFFFYKIVGELNRSNKETEIILANKKQIF